MTPLLATATTHYLLKTLLTQHITYLRMHICIHLINLSLKFSEWLFGRIETVNSHSTLKPTSIGYRTIFIGKVRAINRKIIPNQGTTYQKIVLVVQAIAVIKLLLSKLLSRYLLHNRYHSK